MARRNLTSQLVLGAILIVVGAALLFETTELIDVSVILQYVPSLFVLLGVYALVASGFRNVVGPLIVIGIGGAWQLVALDYLEADQVVQFWPLLIVLFGLSIILGQYRSRSRAVTDAYVSAVGLFGGSEQRPSSSAFEGADLTALFGGVELDLRDAGIEQRPAHVSTTVLFGGVDVIVPRDWNVRIDVLPIFGGAEDERPRRESEHEEIDLIVTGFAAFGGVSVSD